jgi:hypothetical protein
MLHNSIPEDAYYLDGHKDNGKKVIINSIGGAFANKPGVVVVGPYVYPYVHKTEIKAKKRNPMAQKRYKNENKISNPLWLIEVAGQLFAFMETEFKFSKDR